MTGTLEDYESAHAMNNAQRSLCQRCQKAEGTAELHSCPYMEDVNNDPEPYCNCCADCAHECARDI